MLVYRIADEKFVRDLTGTGAAMYGGRWNKKGTPVIYAGESIEIALLETIVHTPPMLVPHLEILTIEIPDHSITKITSKELPPNWGDYPAPTILSEIAEKWIKAGETIALQVPSCIIHTAHNYILNCRHADYSQVKVLKQKPFHFDSRLLH
jgi:RES domain-containing protein